MEDTPAPAGPSTSSTDLPKGVTVLKSRPRAFQDPEQTFYIVGTAHVSTKSCDEVRRVISTVKPQLVMVELCHERTPMLNPVNKEQKPKTRELIAQWRSGKVPLLAVVYSWMLTQVGDTMEVNPGEEFRVAVQVAAEVGAKVILGDRPLSITLARMWAALSAWERVRFIWELLYMGIAVPEKELKKLLEEMQETDVITEAIKEFGEVFPGVVRPLLDERDEFMVYKLQQLRRLGPSQASRVVAVVGAGHLPGIRKNWDAEIDIKEITTVPEKKKATRTWAHILLLASAGGVTVASIAYVIHLRRRR